MDKFVKNYQSELKEALKTINWQDFEKIKNLLLEAYRNDKQIFVAGNGGSASTASHMACDLNKGVIGHSGEKKIKRLKVISLNDNVALMLAWANDTLFESIFAEQLKNLVSEGDVVIGISASGNSKNIIEMIREAKKSGAKTIGFAGFDGGQLAKLADLSVTARIKKYDVAEDVHLILEHMLTRWFYENL